MNYDYNPTFESSYIENEYYDYYDEPVTLDRLIRYVYNIDDCVVNELEQICNQHIQQTYSMEPTSYKMLDTDSDLFIQDDYPERFSEWFFEMIDTINKIGNHE